jgi:hypothetical protein
MYRTRAACFGCLVRVAFGKPRLQQTKPARDRGLAPLVPDLASFSLGRLFSFRDVWLLYLSTWDVVTVGGRTTMEDEDGSSVLVLFLVL